MNCKLKNKCGSCVYINDEYEYSLQKKLEFCKDLVSKSKLNLKVHSVIGQAHPYYYRNKVIIGFDLNGNPGFYEENSHRIIPYNGCLLHHPISDKIVLKITELVQKYHIPIYNEDKRTGVLRHVHIRNTSKTNEFMVTLVVNDFRFKASNQFVKELVENIKEIKTVLFNLNNRKTSVVLGDTFKTVYGKGYIVDKLCGLSFKISPQSFYQINHDQCETLYNLALSYVDFKKTDIVLDTYCGIGTIGMIVASKVEQVIGVELNKKACHDAINNAKMNRIDNIEFINADATELMKEAASVNQLVDIVIMDPPRSGSTKEFIQACAKMKPRGVVYISCDPTTQVRDLEMFSKLGYKGKEMIPVDMFPHTKAVESIVYLTKK